MLKPNNVKGKKLQISLFEKTVNIIQTHGSLRTENNFTWQGKVENKKNSTVVLTVVDGALYGIIKVDRQSYKVRSMHNGKYQLIKLQGDPIKFDNHAIVHVSFAHAQVSQKDMTTNIISSAESVSAADP